MQSEAEDGAVDYFVREWMKQLCELAYDAALPPLRGSASSPGLATACTPRPSDLVT